MLNFLAGIAAALVGVWLYRFLKTGGLVRSWLDWTLVALLYGWGLFTVAFVAATFLEDEAKAAAFGGVVFGLVALLGFIGLRLLFTRRAKKVGQVSA